MKQTNKQTHQEGKRSLTVGTRGRVFQGYVIKKFPKRIVVSFDRTVYVKKYERFLKEKTKLHARVPEGMDVQIGDYVRIQECRPLSKIIHFVLLGSVRAKEAAQ